MKEKIIKSKERVKKHAEVYTPQHLVKNMLKLVRDEADKKKTWTPYLRYLEPACGNGNFLAEILREKLEYIKESTAVDDLEWCCLKALTSIYGVDIQLDNVEECKTRLEKIVWGYIQKNEISVSTVRSILNGNIIVGDTINHPESITFHFYIANDASRDFYVATKTLQEMLEDEVPHN